MIRFFMSFIAVFAIILFVVVIIKLSEEGAQKRAEQNALIVSQQEELAKEYPITVVNEKTSFGIHLIEYNVRNNSSKNILQMDLRCYFFDKNGKATNYSDNYTYMKAGEIGKGGFAFNIAEGTHLDLSNYKIVITSIMYEDGTQWVMDENGAMHYYGDK